MLRGALNALASPFVLLFNLAHSWAVYLYAAIFTLEIGPPIIANRPRGVVARELESRMHRIKMYLMYNRVAEFLDRTLAFRKYLHFHSAKEGRMANEPFSEEHDPDRKQIRKFIRRYKIDASEFDREDPRSYRNFNDFFSRSLKPGSRAPKGGPDRVVSAADSKLVVFPSARLTRKLWIKSREFTVANLIGAAVRGPDRKDVEFVVGRERGEDLRRKAGDWTEAEAREVAARFEGGAFASFRLKLPDYHRFHAPLGGVVQSMLTIPGTDYEVDPFVTTSSFLSVLTGNERVVIRILCDGGEEADTMAAADAPVIAAPKAKQSFEYLFIPIGAQDVGTVKVHPHVRPGYRLSRGEEMGMFAFGGSNIVVAFEPRCVEWDADLLAWSRGEGKRVLRAGKPEWDRLEGQPIECFVRAGDGIGTVVAERDGPAPGRPKEE
ncbi:phosphatidylserine decarboxylase-domain-containing protein [Hyaloraphidium curvatum]|nr:phosphatidylserine decarboxylase-domain-containing protein [Hyaloraphidium curvatum]